MRRFRVLSLGVSVILRLIEGPGLAAHYTILILRRKPQNSIGNYLGPYSKIYLEPWVILLNPAPLSPKRIYYIGPYMRTTGLCRFLYYRL